MAMNNVEWTLENIKKAEKACEEAQQMVIIKTIDVSVPGDTTLPGLGMVGSGTRPEKRRMRGMNANGRNAGSKKEKLREQKER